MYYSTSAKGCAVISSLNVGNAHERCTCTSYLIVRELRGSPSKTDYGDTRSLEKTPLHYQDAFVHSLISTTLRAMRLQAKPRLR